MIQPTKIDFHHRRISGVEDTSELVVMLFPGNRNQQYAAACILFELKWAEAIVPSLDFSTLRYRISRRILQRARAKLARLGLIEHVSSLNARYGGQQGWRLSSRFAGALRQLTDRVEQWSKARCAEKKDKEQLLLEFNRPPRPREMNA